MNNITRFISGLEGKKIFYLSFFFGLLISSALPPIYIIPLAVAGFTGHLLQLDLCSNKKQSFWLGWWLGWGYFTGGLYWISFALLTDFKNFGWMMPFAIFGISAVLAFYTAIISMLTFMLPFKSVSRVLIFAVLWVVFEMLRGILFTGFPWNLIGYIWTFSDSMLQLTSITGIWGLSFVTVIAFAMPFTLFKKGGIKASAICAVMLAVIWAGGYYRLSNGKTEMVDNVKLRIVQANIAQDNKWDINLRNQIVRKYLAMTKSEGFDAVTHVVWPESALPFFMEPDSELVAAIKEVVPKNGAVITGSMHVQQGGYGFIEKIWNSLHVIDDKGDIIAVYDKHHLVPFGEYVPLRGILPVEKITHGHSDFSEGTGVATLSIPNFPKFSPLICYEAIFPGAVIDKNNMPEAMINVTNDAWYGKSSGPYQHFEMVRVRAAEHGIPLIRSANTGISAVIDPYGRIVAETELGEDAVLDSPLPKNLINPTIYDMLGDFVISLFMVLACILAVFIQKRFANKT